MDRPITCWFSDFNIQIRDFNENYSEILDKENLRIFQRIE